jgi:hypothetical protein
LEGPTPDPTPDAEHQTSRSLERFVISAIHSANQQASPQQPQMTSLDTIRHADKIAHPLF